MPEVVTVYGYGPEAPVGAPLIVNRFPESYPVTPAGNPETEAPVAVPPILNTIFVIGVLAQTACEAVPELSEIDCACIIIVPFFVAVPQPTLVVIVKVYVPAAAVGVPLIVNTPPE